MKRFRDTEAWKYIRTLLEIAVIVAVVWTLIAAFSSIGAAEYVTCKAWVICHPGDYVNLRARADRHSQCVGRLDAGDFVELDGTTRNGFARVANLTVDTPNEVWIYTGYLVFDEPVWMNGKTAVVASNKQLAARRNCTGEVRKWLQNGTEVQVFWYSDEWCVTNRGFIMTQWLDLVGE